MQAELKTLSEGKMDLSFKKSHLYYFTERVW